MNGALTGIKQHGIAVLVGHYSSGRLCSVVNNKIMEILKQRWEMGIVGKPQ